MTRLFVFLQSYLVTREPHEDRGATMVEYGLIVAAIAVVVAVAARTFGTALATFFTNLVTKLT